MRNLTLFSKILIAFAVIGLVFASFKFAERMGWAESIAPKGKQGETISKKAFDFSKPTSSAASPDTIKVAVVTWGGYAGGQYFNKGFKPTPESRYLKEYGLNVEFIVIDDWNASREAWKAGSVDLLWSTVDAYTTEVVGLKEFEPKVVFQSDWSRGGDAIVTRRGIESVQDLKGQKVAVAFGTPSHTFLLWLLNAGDLNYSDINVVQAPSAVDAASYFKAKKVDAAVVWSPDDEDCVKNIPGAKILKSTKEASHIIADVFYVKNSFLQSHRKELKSLIEGWMIGASEINSSPAAKTEATKILAQGLNQPEDFMLKAINNTRLSTIGDNKNFFNVSGSFDGVKAEEIYANMGEAYNKINLAPATIPSWRSVSDSSIVNGIELNGNGHEAEGAVKFAKIEESKAKEIKSFSTKRMSVSFASGSSTLDENAKYIIQSKVGDLAKAFASARIRIEGNTDNVGSAQTNLILSKKRAQSVAAFLIEEYKFDPNRFIVVGNGPNKPLTDNGTDAGKAKNRRTDFEFLAE